MWDWWSAWYVFYLRVGFCLFKQKTAYEMRISDWSSDVCSSDLPFELFRQVVLSDLLKARAGSRRLRIWSAACSTGQEAYSLAMILHEEQAKLAGWTVDIVGTDISTEVLARARAGLYTQFEVQRGLTNTHILQYFRLQGDKWELPPDIRTQVEQP